MRKSCRDYRVTRRALLAAGGASIMGLSVRDLVAFAGTGKKAATAEHVIFFWNGGGMTHIDTWDPKPGRPTQGDFEPIKTSAPGIEISEIFPQLAKQMHNAALIRSIAGTNGAHGRATYNLQTGYNQSPNLRHPGIGSILIMRACYPLPPHDPPRVQILRRPLEAGGGRSGVLAAVQFLPESRAAAAGRGDLPAVRLPL